MRKDSIAIFIISIVLTLGIVGGAHYLYLQKQTSTPNRHIDEPEPLEHEDRVAGNAAIPANKRTSKIIKCTQPNGSVFWTNAARCEGADLGNRVSYYDSVKPVPPVKAKISNKNKSESNKKNWNPFPAI